MRRVVVRLVVVALVVVLLGAGWTAFRGWTAYRSLQAVRDQVAVLQQQVLDLDVEGARATARTIQEETQTAREAADDPVWRLVGRFPWGGQNLQALTTSTAAVDDLADRALPAVVDVTAGVVDVRDGISSASLDTDALRRIAAGVGTAQAAAGQARTRVAAVDDDRLLPQVRAVRDDLVTQLDVSGQVQDLVQSLPDLSSLPSSGALQDLLGRLPRPGG